jgi:hypothetical protein
MMFDPFAEICLDAYLSRERLAAALTECGFTTAKSTLDTWATRGGGPPFQKFGHRALYQWGAALEWAKSRLSNPVTSTSELKPLSLSVTAAPNVAA